MVRPTNFESKKEYFKIFIRMYSFRIIDLQNSRFIEKVTLNFEIVTVTFPFFINGLSIEL